MADKIELTYKVLKHFREHPPTKKTIVWDTKCGGLHVQILPLAGTATTPTISFRLRYRVGSGPSSSIKDITLGRFREGYTVTTARRDAIKRKVEMIEGTDPNAQKKEWEEIPTLQQAYNSFAAYRPKTLSKDTVANRARYVRYLGPLLKRRIDKISYRDIHAAFKRITEEHGTDSANKSLMMVTHAFGHVADEFPMANPVAVWKRKGGKLNPEERRKVHAEGAGYVLPRWSAAIRQVVTNPVIYDALMWAMYSGVRKSEIYRLQFTDFELKNGSYTIRVFKNDIEGGKEVVLPLNDQLADIVARRYDERLHSNSHLFWSTRSECGHTTSGADKFYSEISKAAGVRFWMHGFRNTFSTVASHGLFLPDTMVDRLCAREVDEDGKQNVGEGYKNAWTLGELRTQSQKIADRIDDHIAGRIEDDVIAPAFIDDPRLKKMRAELTA